MASFAFVRHHGSIIPVGVAGQVVSVGMGEVAGRGIVRLIANTAVTGISVAATRAAVTGAVVTGTTGCVDVGASLVPVHTSLDRQL